MEFELQTRFLASCLNGGQPNEEHDHVVECCWSWEMSAVGCSGLDSYTYLGKERGERTLGHEM